VTLDPFFISKFEMTQGQWLRVTGKNPSHYVPGSHPGGKAVTLANPVEQVTWGACVEVLRKLDLVLPTEAQWEYACRAGTETVYATGNTVSSLAGFANIADEGSRPYYPATWTFQKGFRDGYGAHAPVGSFKPNAFGIHDMHGNVEELCRDGFCLYTLQVRDKTGLRTSDGSRGHMARGGSHNRSGFFVRCAWRHRLPIASSWFEVGLRPVRLLATPGP